jgi:GR25 family glycosyltransferase involved in LPS biosynthesis
MKNIEDIKNIFYINLDTRPDRKSRFEEEMKKLGLQANRFNAVKNKSGAIGCSISHLTLLKYARDNKLDHIVIMEDDITFLNPEVFINSLNNFLSSEIAFDVLLLAGNNMAPYTKVNDYCVKIQKCQTTTGYLVKQHYYDNLIKNFEEGIHNLTLNLNNTNDYAIDQYWTKLQLVDNWFLLTPLTITQRPDYSNIEKRITNYNMVMLDLDKIHLRNIGMIKKRQILSNSMKEIINNS